MATCQLSPVIDQLRRSTLIRDGAGLTDGQLLSRFIERRDEAAFEALVRRHGPMVLSVGRRLLRNHHDAEDTLQATFLVLVRRAASIAPPEKLANWLYGVAYRTALKAKATNIKRAVKERQAMSQPDSPAPPEPWHELLPLLDQELSRLPDIDQTGNKETQARGRFVRTIATPKLGESVKSVEKDDKGEPRHWLKIKVVKEETVTLGRGYTEPTQSK